MGKLLRKVTGRAVGRYRAMGIQMVISLSFTAVAIVGMVFMGMSLFLRFSTTTYELMEDNSQRVLAQVNMNLDGYLRRMMRVSDTLYYREHRSGGELPGVRHESFVRGEPGVHRVHRRV